MPNWHTLLALIVMMVMLIYSRFIIFVFQLPASLLAACVAQDDMCCNDSLGALFRWLTRSGYDCESVSDLTPPAEQHET